MSHRIERDTMGEMQVQANALYGASTARAIENFPVAFEPVPAAVIHGLNDRMVHVSGGRATARAIPRSELVLLPGMGHDIPAALFEQITNVIRRTANRA